MNKIRFASVVSALFAMSFFPSQSLAENYIAEPILVIQPVYSGVSFYVYRPYRMASGWFVGSGVPPYDVPQGVLSLPGTPSQPVSQPSFSSVAPVWMKDGNFVAIAQWSKTVDRMAILRRPRIPIAWKGNRPSVMYGWTGKNWHQMICKETDSPKETLKRYVYELTKMANRNKFYWRDSDTPALASQATEWGFFWVGLKDLIDLQ